MKAQANKTDTRPWLPLYRHGENDIECPDTSLYAIMEQQKARVPDNIAIAYYNTNITYRALLQNIDDCARAFAAAGVAKGDAVTVCMPNTPEVVYVFYALNKLGAVANMIHPFSAENEIVYYINQPKSRFLVTVDLVCDKIANIWDKVSLQKIITVSPKTSMDAGLAFAYTITRKQPAKAGLPAAATIEYKSFIKAAKGTLPVEDAGTGETRAAILYSGGTTGYPKGICLSNRNFNAVALQSIAAIGTLSSRDRVLSIMPAFHGFGLGICIHTVLCLGATAILRPTFSAKTFHKLLQKYNPTVLAGVPTLYEALLRSKKMQGVNLVSLNAVISGGDSLSVGLKQKIDAFLAFHGTSVTVREGYGLTECVTGSCVTPLYRYKPGSIGIPYPGMDYKIIRPGSQETLAFGEEGEIAISGPSVMQGYLNDEEATAQVLQTHPDGKLWLHTGDLGGMDEEGYIYFKQRIQRMILTSGYNVYPQYIEDVIDRHPDVLMTTVIGVPHKYKRQVAKAFVVLQEGKTPSEKLRQELADLCEKNLAQYSWPAEIVFRKSLPKTLVGKVAYQELLKEEGGKDS